VTGLPPNAPSLGECGSIYIREVSSGYTRKTWTYSLQGNQLRALIRLKSTEATVLELHIPISPDGSLLQVIHKELITFIL